MKEKLYQRQASQIVKIGTLLVGNPHPISVQSMTTPDSMDTKACVEQSIRLIQQGCHIVRLTVPSIKEAENLRVIKAQLESQGYDTPLVADIHFTPNAALKACQYVEKIRINPGNYTEKKKLEPSAYTKQEYLEQIEKIKVKLIPLIQCCKEKKRVMRIGVNHGSLSDRILSRYGDNPKGMVASAMEFVDICEKEGFRSLIISMKASNPQITIYTYRLLMETMKKRGYIYPLHLGVTEAGDGIAGRIKSAIGIGSLLEEGIGDTIRVSLTEEPEEEIDVGKKLVQRYQGKGKKAYFSFGFKKQYLPTQYQLRESLKVGNIGGKQLPVVILNLAQSISNNPSILKQIGYKYHSGLDKFTFQDIAADYVYWGNQIPSFNMPGSLQCIYEYDTWKSLKNKNQAFPHLTLAQWMGLKLKIPSQIFLSLEAETLYDKAVLKALKENKNLILLLQTSSSLYYSTLKHAFAYLKKEGIFLPIILKQNYPNLDYQDLILHSGIDIGGLLTQGLGDGVYLQSRGKKTETLLELSFQILQASRRRVSQTEYISCPSCGRTLFDLQSTTKMIQAKTAHLKGIKIGIMGCIVNGPGEMADADYGYVGSGPGKITLYKGKQVMKKNVQTQYAVASLIDIIKQDGKWNDPSI